MISNDKPTLYIFGYIYHVVHFALTNIIMYTLQVTIGRVRLRICWATSVRSSGRQGARATRALSLQGASPVPSQPR